MNVYVVNYDLRSPGQNYARLYDALKGSGVRALESCWLIESSMNPAGVRDTLLKLIDTNDGLFVSEVQAGPTWASFNLLPGALEWLKARRP